MQRSRPARLQRRASVLPLLGLPLRHAHRRRGQFDTAVLPARDRVHHEVLVVARRMVVRAGVGASAFLAPDAALDHAERRVEHVAELDRLRQVAVEDVALVFDVDVLVPLAQLEEDLALPHHLRLLAEDREVVEHRRPELVANLPRALAVLTVEELAQLPFASRSSDSGTSIVVWESAHSAAAVPERRPKVIVSISELPPRRF